VVETKGFKLSLVGADDATSWESLTCWGTWLLLGKCNITSVFLGVKHAESSFIPIRTGTSYFKYWVSFRMRTAGRRNVDSGDEPVPIKAAVAFGLENTGRLVEELKALLRMSSVSTDPEHVGDMHRTAEFIALKLKRIGMENVRQVETMTTERKGHSVVYADWLHATPGADRKPKPTVLCATTCSRRSLSMNGHRLRLSRQGRMGIS
jgi:hypothetical protein